MRHRLGGRTRAGGRWPGVSIQHRGRRSAARRGCSFWLADSYTLQNRDSEARALFERLLSLRNDVGLLAEEYDPHARRQAGNFSQAFSHVALIGTAMNPHRVGPAERSDPGPAQPRRPRSSANGLRSEALADAEPRVERIMSVRARNAAGTCRCPG
jgi:hypothetical protein